MIHKIKNLWRRYKENKNYLTVDQNQCVHVIACNNLNNNKKLDYNNKIKKRRKYSKGLFALIYAGISSVILGLLVLLTDPYELIFSFKARLTDGSEVYDLWKKPPVELFVKVYVYNYTNTNEFFTKGEKLKVEEIGPFTYREILEQTNITFLENGTVNSVPKHPLVLVPELSAHSEDIVVTVPNVALLGMGNILRTGSFFSRLGFNLLVKQVGSEAMINMTAKEYMWGYADPLVKLGNKFLSSWIYFEKLGIIDRMYDFGDEVANTYTGEDNLEDAGLVHSYNGKTHLTYWGKSDQCNKIQRTSDCGKFSNLMKPNDTVYVYRKPMCRPLQLEYIGEQISQDMKGYRYHFKDEALDNGQINPEFKCYCQGSKSEDCLPHGIIDTSPCFYGFPIAMSYPHFYNGDPVLLEHVDGLKPEKSKHETFFIIQPDVGLPLEVAVRTQINLALKTMPGISKIKQFQNMVLPLVWTETRLYALPQSLVDRFVMYFTVLPVVQQAAIFCLISAGFAVFLAGLLGVLCKQKINDDNTIVDEDEEQQYYKSLLTLSSSASTSSQEQKL